MVAANQHNIELDYDAAREIIYGMPYSEWKDKHQAPASDQPKKIYKDTQPLHAEISGHK